MKSTGIVRKIDDLGRIVLPMEIRKVLDIPEGTPMEIFLDGDKIVLCQYTPGCIFCGKAEELVIFSDKRICGQCMHEIVAVSSGRGMLEEIH